MTIVGNGISSGAELSKVMERKKKKGCRRSVPQHSYSSSWERIDFDTIRPTVNEWGSKRVRTQKVH